jgi:hypothetical protein
MTTATASDRGDKARQAHRLVHRPPRRPAPERTFCAQGFAYAYCFNWHSYSAFCAQRAIRALDACSPCVRTRTPAALDISTCLGDRRMRAGALACADEYGYSPRSTNGRAMTHARTLELFCEGPQPRDTYG